MTDTPLSALPATIMFQFAVPCYSVDPAVWRREGLGERYRIPCFGELEQGRTFADVLLGWNAKELVFQVEFRGGNQAFDPNRGPDVVQFLIDTRATHNVHRASRFCHWFMIYPMGTDNASQRPQVTFPSIPQAREAPKPPPRGSVVAEVQRKLDGYSLRGAILADALTGYDPVEHPKLGFYYLIGNTKLGWQLFTASTQVPVQTDPSLWGDLELCEMRE